jgi:hypothetical protein
MSTSATTSQSHHLQQSFAIIRRQREFEQKKLQNQLMLSNVNIDGSTPLREIASNPFPEPSQNSSIMSCKNLK